MLSHKKACVLAAVIRREVDPSVIEVKAVRLPHGETFCVQVKLLRWDRVQRLGTFDQWQSLQIAWDMLRSEEMAR
jgi:hypothetical protein